MVTMYASFVNMLGLDLGLHLSNIRDSITVFYVIESFNCNGFIDYNGNTRNNMLCEIIALTNSHAKVAAKTYTGYPRKYPGK